MTGLFSLQGGVVLLTAVSLAALCAQQESRASFDRIGLCVIPRRPLFVQRSFFAKHVQALSHRLPDVRSLEEPMAFPLMDARKYHAESSSAQAYVSALQAPLSAEL